MAKSKSSSPTLAPRIWSAAQVAAYLNRSIQWFYEHLPYLRRHGFPVKDKILGGWDSKNIEEWLDQRCTGTSADEAAMLEAARGKH